MTFLEERVLRGIVLEMLANLPGATEHAADLESRMNQRMDAMEQRLDRVIEGVHRDVTVLKSESDHVARRSAYWNVTLP